MGISCGGSGGGSVGAWIGVPADGWTITVTVGCRGGGETVFGGAIGGTEADRRQSVEQAVF